PLSPFVAAVLHSLRSAFSPAGPAPPPLHALSLHAALPISPAHRCPHDRAVEITRESIAAGLRRARYITTERVETVLFLALTLERSEEHTSEIQSLRDLVGRLLLEKKKAASTIPMDARRRTG